MSTSYTLVQYMLPEILSQKMMDVVTDLVFGRGVNDALDHGLYKRTVILPAKDLEELFCRGQKDVSEFTGPRSLAVGDVAVDTQALTAHLCKPHGWEQLTGETLTRILKVALPGA